MFSNTQKDDEKEENLQECRSFEKKTVDLQFDQSAVCVAKRSEPLNNLTCMASELNTMRMGTEAS